MSSTTTSDFNRLPLDVEPINYNLTLTPNLTDFVFDGEVVIDIEIRKSTDQILLNSIELNFDKAILEYNESKITSASVVFSEKTEIATIKFPEALKTGNAKLHIKYTGFLNEKMKGFYRSKYQLPSGETKYAAVTQFEAIDARRALPCWDEPARKATFDVAIIAEPTKTVLSNMPLIAMESKTPGIQKFIFDRTPKMSTYLLAFVVGEFDFVEGKDKNGINIRVYTPVGKKELGRYALDISLKTLPFYTDYFSIGYPLSKLDLIAIGEMGPGAMENWGLITYREDCLLYDPGNSSLENKRRVAIIVGHEIAHQWFGNLVTMEWWTDLWLNEGFASWIEFLCVDHCAPEFDIWTHFVASDWCSALELDSLKTSHPIEVEVREPSEIDEIFDAISYSKGATVIRMLHDYLGDDAYRKGLNNYLEKYKFSNAVTDNLWHYLGEASKKPVFDLMQMWTKQTGYPVVKVEKHLNDKNETMLKLSQKRFFVNGHEPTEEENCLWKIPIKILTKSSFPSVHREILLEKREDEVNLGVIPADDWIKLNKNSIGMYRTNYSKDMLDALVEPVKNKSFHATDRLGLQDDAFNLAQAGLLSTADVLHFIESYIEEDEVTVWKGLLSNLGNLNGLLLSTDFHQNFAGFIRKLVKPISKKLGWDAKPGESSLKSMCRATVLKTLGKVGDEETIEEAKRKFNNHLSGAPISADLRTAVYTAVLVKANEDLLKQFIELHDSSDLQEEKIRLSCALGAVRDKKLIEKVLQFAISDSVRSPDTVSVVESVAWSTTSPEALETAWSFLKNNWSFFTARYATGFMIMDLVKCTTDGFASKQKHDEVKEFFEKNPCPGANRTIQQSLENILKNEAWLKRDQDSLRKFLAVY